MEKIQKILGHFNAFLNNGYQMLSFLIPSFYRYEMDKLISVWKTTFDKHCSKRHWSDLKSFEFFAFILPTE